VLQYIIEVIFSAAPRNVMSIVPGVTNFFGSTYSNDLIAVMGISWACLGSLLFFIRRTHLGRGIRALAYDRIGAIASGIDPDRANLIVWIWAGALAALAGVFFGSYTHLEPGMWVYPLIMAFAIVIVGGLGSIEGSIIAAYIIGMSETAMTMLIAEQLRGVFGMAIMIGILVARPRGLLGKEA
jgi:branched-chain amino acid transport system permease protein